MRSTCETITSELNAMRVAGKRTALKAMQKCFVTRETSQASLWLIITDLVSNPRSRVNTREVSHMHEPRSRREGYTLLVGSLTA
jgi:hypothetical protein